MTVEKIGKVPLQQIEQIQYRFPKLKYRLSKDDTLILEGDLDICDMEGQYWETFVIKIIVPNTFPHCVPRVYEKSEIIPRDRDRHISPTGVCCIDIPHSLLYRSKYGINLHEFISEKVYPFFADQAYFKEKHQFAGKEYPHDFEGVRVFYRDFLNLTDPKIINTILVGLLNGTLPVTGKARNQPCFCGSGVKNKICHKKEIEFLNALGPERIQEDLKGFQLRYT